MSGRAVGAPSGAREGTPPHQHAILLHQIAEIARGTGDPESMTKRQLVLAHDCMRAWIVANAVRLLDDSRALHTLTARRAPEDAAGSGDGRQGE